MPLDDPPPPLREALADLRAELLAEFRALNERLDRLEERLERLDQRAHTRFTCGQAEFAVRLLPALFGWYGTAPFTASEAVAEPAVAVLLQGWSPERLGRFLAAAEGYKFRGWRILREGRTWQVVPG